MITDTNITVEGHSWGRKNGETVYLYRILGDIPVVNSDSFLRKQALQPENCSGIGDGTHFTFWARPAIVQKALDEARGALQAWKAKYPDLR